MSEVMRELRAHEYNELEQREIVLKNILTMFYNREMFTKEKYEDLLGKSKGLSNNNNLHFISKDGHKILIYFISDQNIIKSTYLIKLIDSDNKNTFHLMVARDEKALKPLRELAKTLIKSKIQVFRFNELLINLIDFEYLPKLLKIYRTKEDLEKLYKEFDSIKEFHKIKEDIDPFAKYYYLRKGNVIKVEFLSETSGYKIQYLLCE